MPPCRLGWRKFWKFDYEMVHSGVSLNKFVVSIAPFSTPACPDCSHNIAWTQKTALFACFRFLIFYPFFPGDQLTPFAPMCGRPCETVLTFLRFFSESKKHDFLRFLSCCRRILERCCEDPLLCRSADRGGNHRSVRMRSWTHQLGSVVGHAVYGRLSGHTASLSRRTRPGI